ncbi:MAG: CoA transferase [Microthrixaceae bacterium]
MIPAGALGDISSALFAVIGVQAALRQRDRTGRGQLVDIAMLDAMLAMGDIVTNFWSLGQRDSPPKVLVGSFRAADGWFVLQVAREHQFEALAELVGEPQWTGEERFATRAGWAEHSEDVIRPAIEKWAADRTRLEVCEALGAANIPSGPSYTAAEVIADEHVRRRNMLVEMDRPRGDGEPVLIPGNPVKLSEVAEGPETRVPWVGEHTAEVLRSELGLDDEELDELGAEGVIAKG